MITKDMLVYFLNQYFKRPVFITYIKILMLPFSYTKSY